MDRNPTKLKAATVRVADDYFQRPRLRVASRPPRADESRSVTRVAIIGKTRPADNYYN